MPFTTAEIIGLISSGLVEVLHRAKPERTRHARNAFARDVALVLQALFGVSVRVRVIAIEQDAIAAADLVEAGAA